MPGVYGIGGAGDRLHRAGIVVWLICLAAREVQEKKRLQNMA